MKYPIWASSFLAFCLFFSSCQEEPRIQIAAKDFTEQTILSEMAHQLLTAEGFQVDPVQNCGDTFECQRALREDSIDLMVDYSGTGLFFLGQPVTDDQASADNLRKLYAPLGLTWLDPLGFNNSYRMMIPVDRAQARGIQTFEDLEKLNALRIACPPDFVKRPRDGLDAFLKRHGLRIQGEPLVLSDIDARIRAVQNGRADILVAYGTDGAVEGLGLMDLRDSLHFFPPYQASYIVRNEVLQKHTHLKTTLEKLTGRIDDQTMRSLNYAVEVEGRDPSQVARRWLTQEKLIVEETPSSSKRRPELWITSYQENLSGLAPEAMRTAKSAFPGHVIRHKIDPNPIQEILQGESRIALIGAERFFTEGKNNAPVREERLEATVVVGTRLVHLVRRKNDTTPLWTGNIGAPPTPSGESIIADALLGDRSATTRDSRKELLQKVESGDLDLALIVAPAGDETLARAFANNQLQLVSLEAWMTPEKAARYPYLRSARIPARTYKDQDKAVESLTSQVLLASASPRANTLPTGAGPAAALTQVSSPLTPKEIQRLQKASRTSSVPDSALPSSWNAPRPPPPKNAQKEWIETLLNLLALSFLIWLVFLAKGHKPHKATR